MYVQANSEMTSSGWPMWIKKGETLFGFQNCLEVDLARYWNGTKFVYVDRSEISWLNQ